MFKHLFPQTYAALVGNPMERRNAILADFMRAAKALEETAKELDAAIVETKEEVSRLRTHMEQMETEAKACLWSQRKIEELLGE